MALFSLNKGVDRRRAIRDLLELDDRMLDDMGLVRGALIWALEQPDEPGLLEKARALSARNLRLPKRVKLAA
ncbi:MAG: DUF1127 domain-containing protein [Pseudomonadota bacterium]